MIVVVDTNVFVRETHLLRKKGGPDLLQLLRATNGRLLVPEILYREYVDQTIKVTTEQRSKLQNPFSVLETLLGWRFDDALPDGDAGRSVAIKRLRALEPLTLSEPLTSELLAAAGSRSLETRPPTSKSDHGYKDCLIWESILQLPPGSEVRFVSHDDKAFFEGAAFHPSLIAEAGDRGITVVGYRDIQDLVAELKGANPELDLTASEAQYLTEELPEPANGVAVPAAPGVPATEISARHQPPTGDVAEVARRLSEAQTRFDGLDLKVLAYIAYLDTASKPDISSALADAGVAPDVAMNVAERLKILGFVRDTGSHYLVPDRAIADLVAPIVEGEIIAWLQKNRGYHRE